MWFAVVQIDTLHCQVRGKVGLWCLQFKWINSKFCTFISIHTFFSLFCTVVAADFVGPIGSPFPSTIPQGALWLPRIYSTILLSRPRFIPIPSDPLNQVLATLLRAPSAKPSQSLESLESQSLCHFCQQPFPPGTTQNSWPEVRDQSIKSFILEFNAVFTTKVLFCCRCHHLPTFCFISPSLMNKTPRYFPSLA